MSRATAQMAYGSIASCGIALQMTFTSIFLSMLTNMFELHSESMESPEQSDGVFGDDPKG
jgi:hypothetical protein